MGSGWGRRRSNPPRPASSVSSRLHARNLLRYWHWRRFPRPRRGLLRSLRCVVEPVDVYPGPSGSQRTAPASASPRLRAPAKLRRGGADLSGSIEAGTGRPRDREAPWRTLSDRVQIPGLSGLLQEGTGDRPSVPGSELLRGHVLFRSKRFFERHRELRARTPTAETPSALSLLPLPGAPVRRPHR